MGKELIMKVLNHEDTHGQIPWVPFAGVHAAASSRGTPAKKY